MTGSPVSLAPGRQDLFLVGSTLWAKRIFAEIPALKCFDVPPQPLGTLGFFTSYAKQRVTVLVTGSIQSIYFYLLF